MLLPDGTKKNYGSLTKKDIDNIIREEKLTGVDSIARSEDLRMYRALDRLANLHKLHLHTDTGDAVTKKKQQIFSEYFSEDF
jgi:hypothetical protein